MALSLAMLGTSNLKEENLAGNEIRLLNCLKINKLVTNAFRDRNFGLGSGLLGYRTPIILVAYRNSHSKSN